MKWLMLLNNPTKGKTFLGHIMVIYDSYQNKGF